MVNLYNQLFVIVPFLIMGPGLFTAAFTLGIMMQVSSAFREVQDVFQFFYIIGLELQN